MASNYYSSHYKSKEPGGGNVVCASFFLATSFEFRSDAVDTYTHTCIHHSSFGVSPNQNDSSWGRVAEQFVFIALEFQEHYKEKCRRRLVYSTGSGKRRVVRIAGAQGR